jgi:hypothetical protein
LDQYFPRLKIDIKYKQFVLDIIARAEKKYLHIKTESRMVSKAVGCIHLLCERVPELRHITKDMISQECEISKTTFSKYSDLVKEHYPLFKKVFKRHAIPMEISWKKSI